MKCLKCPDDALPNKALCAACYVKHERQQSYQNSDEWLNRTLDTTRDLFKQKGESFSGQRTKRIMLLVAIFGLLLLAIVYYISTLNLYDLPWRYRPEAQNHTEPLDSTDVPVAAPVVPTIDPESRTVWVGNSPGSVPLLLEALELVRRQVREPDLRWTIRLEPGEHRIAGSIVIPSYSSVKGAGQLQSAIVGQSSGTDFNDNEAALIVLARGSGIEQVSVENEASGSTTVVLRCSAAALANSATPGDTLNLVRGVSIRSQNPSERSYGIVNDGCDLKLEQVNVTTGQASTSSQALLSMGDTAQVSITDSSLVAEDEKGACTAQTTAGCVGLTVLRGTVSVVNSKIRGASQGATVLDGTLQLINSEITAPGRGVTLIQSGALFAESSKISSVSNASSAQVVCKETLRPDGTPYAGDCS